MRTRSILAIAATGLTAATITIGVPAAAFASSGGGCTSRNGVEACISADSTGVKPDAYINALPGGCSSILMYVMNDNTGDLVWQTGLPCKTGHYGPWHLTGSNGTGYTTYIEYTSRTGGQSEEVVSPNERFSN
ncbi:hypothetical protein KGQ19_34100 [Catenulispora sp. NL8]|uniref:Secreted protein n=1 Tax=Catenulispora pinistramenti TaxID=2705254 RepID=A0ABS5L153_9ACTN|nr:hypothetical protein [Catenulispora pinistramenti]MBS2551909.1 hypothetical protein [Catenulispora pinistramenti]